MIKLTIILDDGNHELFADTEFEPEQLKDQENFLKFVVEPIAAQLQHNATTMYYPLDYAGY